MTITKTRMKSKPIMYVHVPDMEHALVICDNNVDCVIVIDVPEANILNPCQDAYWRDLVYITKPLLVNFPERLHNSDLEFVVAVIKKLHNYSNVQGVIFVDVAVLQLAIKYGYCGQLHFWPVATITNSGTAKFWLQQSVDTVLLARELVLEQILSIANNMQDFAGYNSNNLVVQIAGVTQVFSSKRKVITNYNTYIKADSRKNGYNKASLIEEFRPKESYIIVENSKSSKIYNSQTINLLSEISLFKQSGISNFLVSLLTIEDFESKKEWLIKLHELNKILSI